ncbi:MAG TPA: phosphoglycolate phosphatase [Pseudolabrys sp.]|nr:phosphoglycolate phosphatase [Pseudolabrys sp.]
MSAPTLVFDLDGTLIDTAPDLIDTLNVVFAREGMPAVPYDEARNMIGGGARAMIQRGLEAEGRVLAPEEVERMFADFLVHYSAHIADRSRPFPGLVDALDTLSAQGHRLAVCTNKLERLSLLLLNALDLATRFSAICGQDTFGMQKPDPEVLRRTIAAAGGDPRHAIMIGDSNTDIRTARAAGIPVIAVDFGYSERPVAEFGPDRVIAHYAQLPAMIAAIIATPR